MIFELKKYLGFRKEIKATVLCNQFRLLGQYYTFTCNMTPNDVLCIFHMGITHAVTENSGCICYKTNISTQAPHT